MNILIIATNRYGSPIPVMPVGACMIAEAAELSGHRVRVLDLMFDQNPLNTLESELNTSNPDFIGFPSEILIIMICRILWRFSRI